MLFFYHCSALYKYKIYKVWPEHSQRPMLASESYKPIINHRIVKIYSSLPLVLNEIKVVKEGYIFDALEDDWKQRIDDTFKIASKINDIKNFG
ncbi:TPA: hypothetical protein QCX35_004644 [Bacillus toyonensis]|uniref:hypothetical protein n=1 Tax=Bacillus TaxID=1386 RepID=UPI0018F6E267|nr:MULTISPECIES: hypothetical protein [Bacillus]MBJ8067561.1 hypothetical protein [Bacillus cereus group sp. N15]MCS3600026.1 hypothetical protein [Bacillus sp. JUb91]HDR7448502.1 hypothetical protein [Bacillus toyonensis]HDR7848877.1 hypothetical protein [Bacillus toyonensis]